MLLAGERRGTWVYGNLRKRGRWWEVTGAVRGLRQRRDALLRSCNAAELVVGGQSGSPGPFFGAGPCWLRERSADPWDEYLATFVVAVGNGDR